MPSPPGFIDDDANPPAPPPKQSRVAPPSEVFPAGSEEEAGDEPRKVSRRKNADPLDELHPTRRFVHEIMNSKTVDTLIGLVIIFNGITIGMEAEANTKLPVGCYIAGSKCICEDVTANCVLPPSWVNVLETIFFVIYVLELSARYFALGLLALRNNWVQFDTILVGASIVELVLRLATVEAELLKQLMLFRTLRLARLARTVRLMVQFQTLWKLVKGMLYCINTLMWTFVMLGILSFILALFGLELIQIDMNLPLDHPYNDQVIHNFRTVGDAMMFMIQVFSFDAAADVVRPLIKHRGYLLFYFATVILFSSIALMNLVTAIMVEGALRMAEEDKEAKQAWEAARKKTLMEQLKVMFEDLDEDGSGELSMEEITAAPADVMDTLVELAGTDDMKGLFEMMDYDGGGTLATDEFCEGVFKAGKSDKPMEIERLMKQCVDIMWNNRRAISILKGEADDPSNTGDSLPSNSRASTSRKTQPMSCTQPRDDAPLYLSRLEDRMDGLEKALMTTKVEMHKLTRAIKDLPSGTSQHMGLPTRAASPKIKKAAAVFRGKVDHGEIGRSFTGASVLSERSFTGNSVRRKNEVYSYRPPQSEDVDALRRRVAQLENQLSGGAELGVEGLMHRVSQLEEVLAGTTHAEVPF